MKKIALSLIFVAASGIYVWEQSGTNAKQDMLGSTTLSGSLQTGGARGKTTVSDPIPASVDARPPSAPPAEAERGDRLIRSSGRPITTPVWSAAPSRQRRATDDNPEPRPRPAYFLPGSGRSVTRAAMTVASNSGYADGIYGGPAVDAYYGLVQVQAVVQGGRIVGIKVLQYPSDRQTSVAINRQALPMLRDEVVRAQSANVDIISGATLTSEAFIRSLDGALKKAGQ
jgi:uncharacterized protein with FMN-binding domain